MKKNKEHPKPGNPVSDKAAGWLAGKFLWAQRKWALGMDRLFNRLSLRNRKIAMISLFLLMLSYCSIEMARSFGSSLAERPVPFKVPVNANKMGAADLPDKIPKVIARIIRYRRYLDSLAGTAQGSRIRDSLLRQYPGLLDSLRLVERQYCR